MPDVATDRVAAALAELRPLGAQVTAAEPLGPLTTYRVGGSAAVFVRVRSVDDFVPIARALEVSELPLLVVGRGSNLLVADGGFPGVAISLGELADRIDIDPSTSIVTAGSAVLLPVLARRTAAAGLTGFEWAVGVPGSIGGAVRMNAGGHGSDMAASLVDVGLVRLGAARGHEAGVERVPADHLGLRMRGSDIGPADVVLDARLQLAPGDRETSERELREIVAWRRTHQPGGQNAGSVFVNPVPGEVSAGALIDGLGMRGLRHGTATVSEVHANFIQADDGGRADDVYELLRIVQAKVAAETGYDLRIELRLVGFGDSS